MKSGPAPDDGPAAPPNTMRADWIAKKKRGGKLAALTAYDYPTARLLDEAGIDWILVGDSLGMVVLGLPDTTGVTVADMERHTAAAARGVRRALLVADLPSGSYETPESAVRNARRLLDAGARAVKLEGGLDRLAQIRALADEGIPFVGHVGMLPQRVKEEGGYRVKGRSAEEGERLLADALALDAAGALGVVLELVAPGVAAEISRRIEAPAIGIGSGQECDGQILVTHDLVGLFPWFRPRFATPRADIAAEISRAAREYAAAVRGDAPRADPSARGSPVSAPPLSPKNP